MDNLQMFCPAFSRSSLLFARANPTEADCIMETLSKYQVASGQLVNLEKSEASFSRNVLDEVKDMTRNRMNVKTVFRAFKNGPGSWAGPLAHIFGPGRA
ncbi:hypothetical protein MTR_6g445270 [Medicago truncatula]|uniref:Uncharacterized protein n=1 Tax=Medicago truncatula TaxID=3880 RepID=A0A072U8K3_MEDTR|nr:hypothetical protein MTR_6g445270 [Medicago truncatula]